MDDDDFSQHVNGNIDDDLNQGFLADEAYEPVNTLDQGFRETQTELSDADSDYFEADDDGLADLAGQPNRNLLNGQDDINQLRRNENRAAYTNTGNGADVTDRPEDLFGNGNEDELEADDDGLDDLVGQANLQPNPNLLKGHDDINDIDADDDGLADLAGQANLQPNPNLLKGTDDINDIDDNAQQIPVQQNPIDEESKSNKAADSDDDEDSFVDNPYTGPTTINDCSVLSASTDILRRTKKQVTKSATKRVSAKRCQVDPAQKDEVEQVVDEEMSDQAAFADDIAAKSADDIGKQAVAADEQQEEDAQIAADEAADESADETAEVDQETDAAMSEDATEASMTDASELGTDAAVDAGVDAGGDIAMDVVGTALIC
jgi:hypothetical protein